MLFFEFRFLEFFIVVFSVYWSLRNNDARKRWLLGASYFFYASFFFPDGFIHWPMPRGWWFPLLLLASTAIDYAVGLAIEHAGNERTRTRWLLLSLTVNLGVLLYFKYAGMFLDAFSRVAEWWGLPTSAHTLSIILPVGVSFYTFQSLSYTIEVYRRHRPPERRFLDLAAFVAFFPQLVAGPIVRAAEFLPQLKEKRAWAQVDVRLALVRFMIGFFKKAVIANGISPFVDRYFSYPQAYTTSSAILAVLLYATQIYCDFSGYTDMALAAAGLLGYELSINFDFPYFARNPSEFWRRWHISLSSWLRDYLYISLGGNRGSLAYVYRNLFLTMLLGGLWHGSRWAFALWGACHGAALIVHRCWASFTASWTAWRTNVAAKAFCTAANFYFVCLLWIPFRAASPNAASDLDDWHRMAFILRQFTGIGASAGKGLIALDSRLFAVFGALALVHWLNSRKVFAHWWRRLPAPLFAVGYGCVAELMILFVPVKYAPFIYFQF